MYVCETLYFLGFDTTRNFLSCMFKLMITLDISSLGFSQKFFSWQVLTLEFSSGMEAVRCISRMDLTLTGSFADMILVSSAGTSGSDTNASLFILSNPGRIHIYDRDSLSSPDSQSRKELSVSTVNFPATVPTVDPFMTVAELFHVYRRMEGLDFKVI